MLDALAQDLRYGLRGLRSKPGFTAGVVLTLALGIGANSAMFGIIDRMLFRSPPYMRDPGTVHRVYAGETVRGKERLGIVGRYARYVDLSTLSTTLSASAGFSLSDIAVGVGDAARQMHVASVSASFFGFFDAPPAIGRYFTVAEDQPPDGTPVTVLSYGMWRTQYGGRADALGPRSERIEPANARGRARLAGGFRGFSASCAS